jgi:hypothetical protein
MQWSSCKTYRNFKCKCNIIIEVSFFSMFDDGYEIFVNCEELEARSELSTLKGVEGCVEAPKWD